MPNVATISGTAGTVTFLSVSPSIMPPPAGEMLESLERRGFDGSAYRRTGRRAPIYSVTAVVDRLNASAADTTAALLAALKGEVCNYTSDHSLGYFNVLLLEAVEVDRRAIRGSIGGTVASSTVLVTFRLDLQDVTNV